VLLSGNVVFFGMTRRGPREASHFRSQAMIFLARSFAQAFDRARFLVTLSSSKGALPYCHPELVEGRFKCASMYAF